MQNIYHDHRYATFASQPILEMMEMNPRAGTTSRNTAITAIETKEELETFNANLEVNTYMAEMLCSLLYAIDHIKFVKERLDKIIDLLFTREFL